MCYLCWPDTKPGNTATTSELTITDVRINSSVEVTISPAPKESA